MINILRRHWNVFLLLFFITVAALVIIFSLQQNTKKIPMRGVFVLNSTFMIDENGL